MAVGRSSQGSVGYAQSGLLGVHRDQVKWAALAEDPTFESEIAQIDTRTFTPGAYHRSMERIQGNYSCSGSFVIELHPEEGIEFMKGALGSVTSTELTGAGSGIYEHEFLGGDTIPMPYGFSLTFDMDLIVYYISGAVVTTVEMAAELNGMVRLTVNWIGKKWESAAAGTSGTSQGQNAISYNVVVAADSNDDFKLAIDGGTVYECTVAAGTYTAAAALEDAINAAIVAQASLEDSDGVLEVACYIDSNNKCNFYTADKGTGASVAWTAGTNDINSDLGYGTPVEAAGTAALAAATYSSVQPFKASDLTIIQDSTEICVDSFTLTIDAGIIARFCLGHKFMKAVNLEKKREVSLAFTKDYEDETQVAAWEANSDVEFEANFRTLTEIVAASGVNYDSDLYLKKCRITNSPIPKYGGGGPIKQEVGATVFYEDATFKDAKYDVNNTMSSMRN